MGGSGSGLHYILPIHSGILEGKKKKKGGEGVVVVGMQPSLPARQTFSLHIYQSQWHGGLVLLD